MKDYDMHNMQDIHFCNQLLELRNSYLVEDQYQEAT